MATFNLFGLRKGDLFSSHQWTSLIEEWIPRARMVSSFPGADGGPTQASTSATRDEAQAQTKNSAPPIALIPSSDPSDAILPGSMILFDTPVRDLDGPGSSDGSQQLGDYVLLLNTDLSPNLFVDVRHGRILEGGAQDPVFGSGSSDTLVLNSADAVTTTLHGSLVGLENIVFDTGDYDLTVTDDHVARGGSLSVNGMPLGAGETVRFDGSAELDGRFHFTGSMGNDSFRGGAGADLIYGNGGGDELWGGAGGDRFVYGLASESSGADYDSLLDFNFASDRIDLVNAVTGFNAAINTGALSASSFNADLASAIGSAGLQAGKAVYFTANSGDLAGTVFLVVDANGKDGYQAGEDFVFALPNADPAALGSTPDFFV
jgi:Ca2+-binding RTX toxin-like protein